MAKVQRHIYIDDTIWRGAKIAAATIGITLSEYVEKCIEDNLHFNEIEDETRRQQSNGSNKTS